MTNAKSVMNIPRDAYEDEDPAITRREISRKKGSMTPAYPALQRTVKFHGRSCTLVAGGVPSGEEEIFRCNYH